MIGLNDKEIREINNISDTTKQLERRVNGQPQTQKATRKRRRRLSRNQRRKAARARNRINTMQRQGVVHNRTTLKSLYSLLNPTTRSWVEAIVDPFNSESNGALIPDDYTEPSLPATDRWSFTIDPSIYTGIAIAGIAVAFLPRCFAAKWLNGPAPINNETTPSTPIMESSNGEFALVQPQLGIVGVDEDMVPELLVNENAAQADESTYLNTIVADAYHILVFAVDAQGQIYGVTRDTTGAIITAVGVVNFVRSSRLPRISQNCDSMRIVGAGLKVQPNQAVINTGGKIYAGACNQKDLYKSLVTNKALTEERLMNERKQFAGVKGATVRYVPLQSAAQEEFQEFTLGPFDEQKTTSVIDVNPQRTLALASTSGQPGGKPTYAYQKQVGLAAEDLCTPGDDCPMIFWKYNLSDTSTGNNGPYSLNVDCRIHIQGKPDGQTPFASTQAKREHNFDMLKAYLNHRGYFPLATEGHSFKSFMSKVSRITRRVNDGVGKAAQIAHFISQVL